MLAEDNAGSTPRSNQALYGLFPNALVLSGRMIKY